MHVSRWTEIRARLAPSEMEALLQELQPKIFLGGAVVQMGEAEQSVFLAAYRSYFEGEPASQLLRSFWSCTASIVEEQRVSRGIILKPQLPVIQLQPFSFGIREGKFVPSGDIRWGVQFAYPQLFQDPKTEEIMSATNYPNSALFRRLQRWMRAHTMAAPFEIGGKSVRLPIRLGKELA